jgi:hypothetical protein
MPQFPAHCPRQLPAGRCYLPHAWAKRLLRTATVGLALLGISAAVASIRAAVRCDRFVARSDSTILIVDFGDRLMLRVLTSVPRDTGFRRGVGHQSFPRGQWPTDDIAFFQNDGDALTCFGLGMGGSYWTSKSGTPVGTATGAIRPTRWRRPTGPYRDFTVPYPLLAIAGALPLVVSWGERRRYDFVRRSRVAHGRCPGCGYDLFGTSGKCPECGLGRVSVAAGGVRRKIQSR